MRITVGLIAHALVAGRRSPAARLVRVAAAYSAINTSVFLLTLGGALAVAGHTFADAIARLPLLFVPAGYILLLSGALIGILALWVLRSLR